MTDAELSTQRLLEANALREPLLRSIIRALELPPGSAGLDAGCGLGLQALLLADAVGPGGRVTGVDCAAELLARGEELVRQAGASGRVTLRQGDVRGLPFGDGSFDWAWSADCVGYPAGDLAPLAAELARVVRPGGRVILLGWSSQQLLPGHPLLEARLNATCSGYLPFLRGQPAEHQFARALRSLRAAGLVGATAQTFVRTLQAPLSAEERAGLRSLFGMLWGAPQPEVARADWDDYLRLCLAGSPDDILSLPEYYAFFTYSLFQGTVGRSAPRPGGMGPRA